MCISNALNLGYYSIMAPPRGFFQGLVIDIVVFFQALVIGIVIGFSYDMDLLTYFGFLEASGKMCCVDAHSNSKAISQYGQINLDKK